MLLLGLLTVVAVGDDHVWTTDGTGCIPIITCVAASISDFLSDGGTAFHRNTIVEESRSVDLVASGFSKTCHNDWLIGRDTVENSTGTDITKETNALREGCV